VITAVFPDLKTGFEDIADADVKLRRGLGEMRGSFLLINGLRNEGREQFI
jgi:hypothetical protein